MNRNVSGNYTPQNGIEYKFNKYASNYDESRKQLIPCFHEFYKTVIKIIPFKHSEKFAILDIGAGTGLLTELIAKKYSKAQITLIDISAEMLSIAQERLKKYQGVSFQVGDYSKYLPEQKYKLIVSSLSIHHLCDNDKKKLFEKIKNSLEQNGIFINADQILGESHKIEKIYHKNWLKEVTNNGVTDQALAEALDRMKEDKMTPLPTQLNWLKKCGFSEVNCWYKNYRFAVYSATNKQRHNE
jgi:tRNA (cmo5U34)-methyltransferase